ncbi:MAG TPA: ABC transporter substrate-binding protein [Myxococcaceae bacterium]|nr:ABC transporter substrate-binding protein [Myxococcaceae bacterium]
MNRKTHWLSAGAACLAIAACGGDEPDQQQPPPEEFIARPLVMGARLHADTFDPHTVFDALSAELIQNISSPLMQANLSNGLVETDFAAELPEVSPDGLTYTFKLRSGVKFADGTDVTAAAFVRSFTRGQLWKGTKSFVISSSTVDPYVQNVESVDPLTVRFTLTKPASRFPSVTLSVPYVPTNAVFPDDMLYSSPRPYTNHPFVKDALAVQDPTQLLGSGAYRIAALDWTDLPDSGGLKVFSRVQLKANPEFYGERVHADPVTLVYKATEQELYDGLLDGSVNVYRQVADPTLLAQAFANPDLNVSESGTTLRFLAINTNDCIDNGASPSEIKGCPLNLRKAFAKAMDRDALVKLHDGQGEAAYSVVPRSLWSHVDTFPGLNLDEARALLSEEGYTAENKLKLAVLVFGSQSLADAVKASLEATGAIEVRVTSNLAEAGSVSMVPIGWVADYPDPASFIDVLKFSPFQGLNPQVEAAGRETNYLVRQQLYEQLQRDLAEQIPVIPLTFRYTYMATQKNVVAPIGPAERLLFKNVRFTD